MMTWQKVAEACDRVRRVHPWYCLQKSVRRSGLRGDVGDDVRGVRGFIF